MAVQFPKVRGIPSCINLSTYVQGMSDYEILCQVVQVVNKLSELASLSVITYADPIDWNITTQYSQNTVVVDPADGTAYLSTQPVPSGVQISNTDYWTPIFTLENFTTFLKTAITTVPQQEGGQLATQDLPANSVFFVGDVLCTNKDAISKGTMVIVGSNCRQVSIVEIINNLMNTPTAWYRESDTSINMGFPSASTAAVYCGDVHTYEETEQTITITGR